MRPSGQVTVGASLSLSGRFARFGRQAAQALEVWSYQDRNVEVVLEDDGSEPSKVQPALTSLARRSDLLLGPYSTQLMRIAGRVAADNDWLLWNHGGSGDQVEVGHPGHVISVLTPTSRYGTPFLRYLADNSEQAVLWIVHGKGSFGRQVALGGENQAQQLNIDTHRAPSDELFTANIRAPWDLFSAGTFEADVELINRAQLLDHPPRTICSVAAGVREFGKHVGNPEGIFGVGQWFPGAVPDPSLGPSEADFLTTFVDAYGAPPDYPAIQAVAAAIIAVHVAREAQTSNRDALWTRAASLNTSTLFGDFGIDPVTGAQTKHAPVLVRWTSGHIVLA